MNIEQAELVCLKGGASQGAVARAPEVIADVLMLEGQGRSAVRATVPGLLPISQAPGRLCLLAWLSGLSLTSAAFALLCGTCCDNGIPFLWG